MAKEKSVPLLFDTDMPDYAKMYQHLGCTLYNMVTADNGVTRHNLVLIQQALADGIHRIYAECDLQNVGSWRLLEALGFEKEAHLKKKYIFLER